MHAVVPRAWTLVWCVLCDVAAPERVPDDWFAAVMAEAGTMIPATLRDPPDAFARSPFSVAAEETNRRTVDAVRR